MDNATRAICSAFLVAEEGAASTLRGLSETIARHGLFCELYTDRGSHYFYTPPAFAGQAPARGRSERAFRTLQDRLPKALRLAGISTVERANGWLAEHYIALHNAAFAVTAEQEGTAFVPDRAGAWREALCIREERRVGNDNTVAWRRWRLQIPPGPIRSHYVRAMVRVHEYPDGRLSIYHGPHRLADYTAAGTPIEPTQMAA
jgi:hypothetical protein